MVRTLPVLALVDDDADVRVALSDLIASAGFTVEAFASGVEFLQSVDDHEPDCVVLDLHMPAMSGFDIQSELANAHAGVPVVVITAHDSAASRSRALRLGAKGYLSKPVDGETLLSAIAIAMSTG